MVYITEVPMSYELCVMVYYLKFRCVTNCAYVSEVPMSFELCVLEYVGEVPMSSELCVMV